MSTLNSTLTAEQLREFVDYAPDTGIFTWKSTKKGSRVKAGSVAGAVRSGRYVYFMISKRNYAAHRLAWLYVYGEWPDGQIDHINRVKQDNRISNLRVTNNSENQQNTLTNSRNKSGFKGVVWYPRTLKWRVEIMKNGKSFRLGHFVNIEDAKNAYVQAAKALHTHNAAAESSVHHG